MTTQRTLNDLMYPAHEMWELIGRVQAAMPVFTIPADPWEDDVDCMMAVASGEAHRAACAELGVDPLTTPQLHPEMVLRAGARAQADYMISAEKDWKREHDLPIRYGGIVRAVIMNVVLTVNESQAAAA